MYNSGTLQYIVQHARNSIKSDPKKVSRQSMRELFKPAQQLHTMLQRKHDCMLKKATANNCTLCYCEDFGDDFNPLQAVPNRGKYMYCMMYALYTYYCII